VGGEKRERERYTDDGLIRLKHVCEVSYILRIIKISYMDE
jgi:hypothetical protein